ncbi:MAG: hypothetical protein GX442_07575 [Candidatus Riflebacteria bacterium]|nr:hypothetical protein [Candidatus Riflebacteria bacterium]
MIATMVMAMMLISLLGFVHITSTTWQRTDQQINLTAEANMVIETLKFYAENAATMTPPYDPTTPQQTGTPSFTIFVATGSIEAGTEFTGTVSVKLQRPPGQPDVLVSTYTTYSPTGAEKITFKTVNEWDGAFGISAVSLNRFIGTLTEHLASLTVQRTTMNNLDVYLRLESPSLGETYDATHATPAFEITATLLGPNLATEPRIWSAGGKAKGDPKAFGKAK